ncbi:MAG: metallophosphoesterase [Nanoarchaeota archaeon]|nr:metallophosphoesterase [Nanoarchaeota archaeon]
MTKILAFGDIHGDRSKAKELAEKARRENVDLVVICGDFSNNEEDVSQLLGLFDKKVLIIPGNHESPATVNFLSELYKFKNLHGYYYNLNNVGFFGCGSANIGLFQLSENEIFKTLKKGFYGVKACTKKIMVSHNHPEGSIMERFSKFVPGSKGIRKAIEEFQPDILFCCHVHEAHGVEEKMGQTKVINVGRDGKIIDL